MNVTKIELRENWRFHLGECEEAWYKGYDDSGWRTVTVPHDWSVEAPFSRVYSSGTGYLQGGTGWYRVRFRLPEACRGKKIRLCFDGVYKNSQVFCNSYYLGKRPNGYVSFSYDISGQVVFGEEENEVSVKVVHNDLADSRWFTGSGITRKVTLLVEEPVHPAEYGCTFRTDRIFSAVNSVSGTEKGCGPDNAVQAQISVAHEPVNDSGKPVSLKIRTALLDRQGCIAAEFTDVIALAAGERGRLTQSGSMESPALWSPESPCLYRMQVRYSVDGGEAYLACEEKVGVRSIEFVPDQGFFLNGINQKIKGVCVHHDGGCLGAAMRPEVWQRRLALLKECGCNAIRCSHNPHMPELYELCDAMGFLMMDEAFDEWENAKNKWSVGHNVYPPRHQGYYEDFPQWHEEDLRAMVRRDRNHPSVILWSIGNEIDYPNDPYCHPMFQTMTGNNDADKPAAEMQYDSRKPNMERLAVLAARLAAIVREEDDSRPVTVAAAFPELSSQLGFFDALSVVGYNYKEHLYEEDHRRFPDKTFLGSENGHSEEAWRAVTEHPYICGQFLWTGIDYLGEAHGWPVHGSPAGLLTTAGFPKPEFEKRKRMWQEETSDEQGNCGMQRTALPGMTGTGTGSAIEFRISEKETDGVIRNAVDAGITGERNMVRKQEQGTEKACGMSVTVWQEKDILTGMSWEESSQKTGYLYQILVQLTNRDGHKVMLDDREVRVQVQGDGCLAGIDNGDLADVTPFGSGSRKTYRGDLAVYVRRTGAEDIRVFLQLCQDGEPDCLSDRERIRVVSFCNKK